MQKIEYNNLDKTEAYKKLLKEKKPRTLSDLLDKKRINDYQIAEGGGLIYNYAAKAVDEELLDGLQRLSDEQQLIAKYRRILDGDFMNTGENRRVLHHLSRGQLGESVIHDDKNIREFYVKELERIYSFARDVHNGKIGGSTGKKFNTVVQIGIGGSDLGPRALYLALKEYAAAAGAERMKAFFISNVDPDDADAVLASVDPETTLFIVVSKSGTTQETLTNREFALQKMRDRNVPGFRPGGHMVAVTSETSPLADNPDFLDSFYIDDFIGGRYSSCSAVGAAVLSLAFSPDIFSELLAGAHEADKAALKPAVRENAALLDALIGVYERNILDYRETAILPYSQALSRFPAHLQQLDMESNGKQVNRRGEPLSYQTGPVLFGEPGTNGQHSFYQLLHQGTQVIPLQFIGFKDSQSEFDIEYEGSSSRTKLAANLAAQITAFALGEENSDPNKHFPGERPSSLLYAEKLTPRALGGLLGHFENKVMFQGLVWNINSFDQEGVQLGKVLTKKLLGPDPVDEVLETYAGLLDIRK